MGKAMMAVNAAAWPPHQPQITSDGRPRIIIKRATSELYVNAPQVGTPAAPRDVGPLPPTQSATAGRRASDNCVSTRRSDIRTSQYHGHGAGPPLAPLPEAASSMGSSGRLSEPPPTAVGPGQYVHAGDRFELSVEM